MHFLAIGNRTALLFEKKTLLSYNACNLSNHRYIIILNLPRVFNNLHVIRDTYSLHYAMKNY